MSKLQSQEWDEARLARLCAGGNASAQKQLFMQYSDGMLLLCLRYITNYEDAREAMMDGFLAAYSGIRSFEWRGEGSLKAWLKKVMVNRCLSRLRKRQMRFETVDMTEDTSIGGGSEDISGRLHARDIINMIQQLPDGCRTVFNLYVFEQMGHAEIGTMLDISENTSKSQLHRARALLKEKILQPEKTTL